MFNKDLFTDDYLDFSDDFKIDENDGNLIILGPNGIGKSTIYKITTNNHPEHDYIDYEEFKNDFKKNKNKLIIGAQIMELEEKYIKKEQIINDLHIKDNFKDLNITTQKKAKEIFSELKDSFINIENSIQNFNNKKLDVIKILDTNNISFLISNFPKLFELNNIDKEIINLKEEFINNIYNQVDKILNDEEKTCPLCGTICDKPRNIFYLNGV